MGLRLKLFGCNVRKYTKKHAHQKQFVDYEHAKRILLLYESDLTESRTFINEIVRAMQADGKQADVVGYVAKKQCVSQTDAHFKMIDKKQTTCFGKPQKTLLNTIAAQKYDLIIDLTRTFCLPLQYVLLQADAKCRVGGCVNKFGLIDMVVKPAENGEKQAKRKSPASDYECERALLAAILRYLKEIKMK